MSTPKSTKIYPYSKLDNCALCDQAVGQSRFLALLQYSADAAIAYRLCRTCKPNAQRRLSDVHLKTIEMSLDVEAEKLGLIKRDGRAQ